MVVVVRLLTSRPHSKCKFLNSHCISQESGDLRKRSSGQYLSDSVE